MDLPNFITKALGFFGLVESQNTRIEQKLDKLTSMEAQVTKLQTDLATANQALQTEQAEHAKTKTALEAEKTEHGKTKTELDQAKATIADPKGEIQKLATMKANEIALRMGAAPIKAQDHTTAANGGRTLLDTYLELNLKDPKAAAAFAAQHGGASGLLNGK